MYRRGSIFEPLFLTCGEGGGSLFIGVFCCIPPNLLLNFTAALCYARWVVAELQRPGPPEIVDFTSLCRGATRQTGPWAALATDKRRAPTLKSVKKKTKMESIQKTDCAGPRPTALLRSTSGGRELDSS